MPGACCMLLTAVYDLNFGTVAYDFITWLARAKLEQQRAGAQGLHIVVLPNTEGLGGFARRWGPHDEALTRWRLWNIVVAACPLAGATLTLAPSRELGAVSGPVWMPSGPAHFLGPLVEAARAGESVPMLRPSGAALRWAARWTASGKTVTLTLRRNNPLDGRDSSDDWPAFADWLKERGWRPLILRDTEEVLRGGPQGELAAISIDLRAALYASAAQNCFVNNGPMVLAWHIGAPYLAFCAALPANPWHRQWQEKLKLAPGEQLPWASPAQRLIYRPDSLDVMTEEFERWTQTGSS